MHWCRYGLAVVVIAGVGAALAFGAACGASSGGGADHVDVGLVAGADASHLRDTAVTIAHRLQRLGVVGATAKVAGRAIRVSAPRPVDAFALEAAARTEPVVMRPVNASEPPPCRADRANLAVSTPAASVRLGAPALGGFCLSLGPGVALGSAKPAQPSRRSATTGAAGRSRRRGRRVVGRARCRRVWDMVGERAVVRWRRGQ